MNKIKKYAQLAVKIGLNVQKGDVIFIRSSIDAANFTREVAYYSYEAGAKKVSVEWRDDLLTKLAFEFEPLENFKEFPQWKVDRYEDFTKNSGKLLTITSSDPDLLEGIDSEKIIANSITSSEALKNWMAKMMKDDFSWSVVAVPSEKWAEKVFPEKKGEKAIEALWDAIFDANRINEKDPVKAWKNHLNYLTEKANYLNEQKFKKLHYKNSKGTDLIVELPEKHLWLSGSSKNKANEKFLANIPTEEIFTLPKKDGVNGTVYSTKPLAHNGQLIDDFILHFKDGKVIDYSAKLGEKVLDEIFAIDEGASFLGEVALVPNESPISLSNLIFFNTLFDENASCHFALGEAYPTCLEGGENMNDIELEINGANRSLTHIDFMIGDKDLEIIGIKEDGKKIKIFEKGNWT